ncbi:MAG: SAM-dependent methyltransferase [Streptosporangiaceae bacterium]
MPPPSIARVYDYLLGGDNHAASDREVGDRITTALPQVYVGVREQRALLRRVVRYLVTEAGGRQVIDIGSGLPTAGNVHEIACQAEPGASVAYVDNDPGVVAHSRALLAGDAATTAIEGDLRHPRELLADPRLRRLIDLDRPVGLLLCGILHYISDDADPWRLTRTLSAALPSGSYLFVHHLLHTDDPDAADAQAALREGLGRGRFRTADEIVRFFEGYEIVGPGLVPVPAWRPDPDTPAITAEPVLRLACCGVGRKH